MKKFYITTSIAYTNAKPHIGFALELIQADVIARYRRSVGDDVFFLTGTDEHGSKIAEKAKEAGKTPKEFCDEISESFKELTKVLNISNNDFIRTTDQERHWPGVYKLWNELKSRGDIYEKDYEGLYCTGCEVFILPKDLVNGKCPYHDKEPEIIKEKNYFFRLSKYAEEIKNNIKNDVIEIIPHVRRKEMLAFVEDGLNDISFSRPKEKVEWGIPVPDDESQSIYCWADALTNYISVLGYGRQEDNFKKYWPADVHCIGKDIQKFHILIWQGMLLSLGMELPKRILVHGFLTVDGKKMSKSLGNVIDPFGLTERYGAEAVRYFFLREISPTEDGNFSEEKFKERYNSDLADGLGNLVARIISMINNVDLLKIEDNVLTPKVKQKIDETKKKIEEAMEQFKFNVALEEIWKLISFTDTYIELNRPWEKNEKNEKVIQELGIILKTIAEMIEPFMPQTSKTIITTLSEKTKKILFSKIL